MIIQPKEIWSLHDHWSSDECPDDQMSLNNGRVFCCRRRFSKPSSGLGLPTSPCLRTWHSLLFTSQSAWPSLTCMYVSWIAPNFSFTLSPHQIIIAVTTSKNSLLQYEATHATHATNKQNKKQIKKCKKQTNVHMWGIIVKMSSFTGKTLPNKCWTLSKSECFLRIC